MEISINLEEFSLSRFFFAKLMEFFAKLNFSAICSTQGGGKALKKQACSTGYSQVIQLLDGKTTSKQLKFIKVSQRKTTEM